MRIDRQLECRLLEALRILDSKLQCSSPNQLAHPRHSGIHTVRCVSSR